MDELASIIILNYNGNDFLYNCIRSVLSQTYTNFEIIFVDNGSNNDSFKFVTENFNDKRIKTFHLKNNLGFAGGNNFGLKQCKGNYIVLLNNDTIVDMRWLEELIISINNFENAGIVQSLIKTEGIPERYYKKNGSVNFLGHNIMEIFPIDDNGKGIVLLAGGASLIFKRELLKDDIIFPKEYFLYAEDTYLSFYSLFSGKTNYHNANSVVYHIGSATVNKNDKKLISFYQERNRLLNFIIFFRFNFLLKIFPYFILNFVTKIIISLLSNKYSLIGIIKSYIWLISNIKWIKQERIKASKVKNIPDENVISLLTYKLFNGNNIFERALNYLSRIYCIIMNIKTVEFN